MHITHKEDAQQQGVWIVHVAVRDLPQQESSAVAARDTVFVQIVSLSNSCFPRTWLQRRGCA